MMSNPNLYKYKNSKGFTVLELMVVATIIGLLLAIALPNLLKARISANHANAKKSLQSIRDVEYEYAVQDLDNDGNRNFTDTVGSLNIANSLRCPGTPPCDEIDALLDSGFEDMETLSASSDCIRPRVGYCLKFTDELTASDLDGDFGWEVSPASVDKTGTYDMIVFADGLVRCTVSTKSSASEGLFEATRASIACD